MMPGSGKDIVAQVNGISPVKSLARLFADIFRVDYLIGKPDRFSNLPRVSRYE